MTVRLALYKAKGEIGNALIRWWTRSPYSHCELLLEDGYAYSSSIRDGGVRRKIIDLDSGHWDVIDIPWADNKKIYNYYLLSMHDKYGWLDLLHSQVFNTALDQPRAAFCSEWCAAALGLPSPTLYSPATLDKLVRYLNANR